MMKKIRALWVMHSGGRRDAHSDFVGKSYISLGWPRLGDLRLLGNDRKAFNTKFRQHYPGPEAAVRIKASELYRFVHKMERKDFVIYPSRKDGLVRVGRVAKGYEYKPDLNRRHPHVRKIRWLSHTLRNTLPLNVKRALSRRSALYEPRKHVKELRKILLH